jgi:drug/metabolite transporter (DMT)-like permease
VQTTEAVARADATLRRKVFRCFAAIYLIWGSTYLVARIGVLLLPVFLFAGTRFLLSAALLLGIARLRGERVWPVRGEWRDVLLLALCSMMLSNGIGAWALQYVPSNVAALLNASAPLWIVLIGMLGRRAHRPSRRAIWGLVLGFAGTVLIINPGARYGHALMPQLVLLCGVVMWGVATLIMRNQRTQLALFAFMGQQMLWGGLGLTATGLATGELQYWHWSWVGIGALLYLVLLSSCFAHTAYAWLAQHTTPARLATYGYVNPLLAMVLGWAVLGEALAPVQLAGVAVVLLSVALTTWPARQAAARLRE